MAGKMKTKTLVKGFPVSKLKPYERNPRINKKAVDAVAKSIQRVGNNDPIEVNEKYVILCGHTRKLALEKLGIKTTDILVLSGLTEKQQKEYRITNNKTGELAEWDFEILEADFSADDLIEFGFDIKDLTQPEVVEDEAPPVPKKARTVRGDIYTLGNHRVMCGDSTMIDEVEKLMGGKKADCVVTDPPYNTGMQGKPDNEKARLSHMFNDKIENWGHFLSDIFNNYVISTKGDCAFYCFVDWRKVGDIRSEMEKHMDVKNVIVWDKKVHGLGSDYKSTYEMCVVGKKGKPEIHNRFGLDYQDIWRLQREMGRNKDHATAKPIELLIKPINHASRQDDIVLDLFLGSGSTLIACEQTNRICYGMELVEKYCDVIVQRWVNFTGGDVILNGKKIKWGKTDGRKD